MRPSHVSSTGRTILVVDDQEETLRTIRKLLEREGHAVLTADRGSKALALLEKHDVQVMLIDYFMPVMSGELLIRAIRNRNTTAQIILQTGYSGEQPPREMMRRLAIQGYHDKCEGPERLLLWVDAALKNYDSITQLNGLRTTAQPPVGVTDEFRRRLNGIVGSAGLARRGSLGSVSTEVATLLDDVIENGTTLLELLDGSPDPAARNPQPKPAALEAVDLAAFLRAAVLPTATGLRLDLPDEPMLVSANRTTLRFVIDDLVRTATKGAPGTIVLSLAADAEGRIALCIGREPGGMPAADTKEVPDVAVPRAVARAMGGDVVVEGESGRCTLTLVLPTSERPHGETDPPVATRGVA